MWRPEPLHEVLSIRQWDGVACHIAHRWQLQDANLESKDPEPIAHVFVVRPRPEVQARCSVDEGTDETCEFRAWRGWNMRCGMDGGTGEHVCAEQDAYLDAVKEA